MTCTWQETAGDSNVSTGDIGAEPREGHSGAAEPAGDTHEGVMMSVNENI